jgi:hypothetical protein
MPRVAMAENPDLAQKIMRSVEEPKPKAVPPPEAVPPPSLVHDLCGGYMDDNGTWVKEFEVRELTGRDEEHMARIKEPSKILIAILERGLVRVGGTRSSPEVVDSLLAGDWETVLLEIRIATFGKEHKAEYTCTNCREKYEAVFDLSEHIGRHEVDKDDIVFTAIGRHGTRYTVTHSYGATQRKILSMGESPMADGNTRLLTDCLMMVGDRPSLGQEEVRDLPMADRKMLINEIDKRRVGPELRGVKTKCPACGNEQPSPLYVAALFQW